MKRERLSRISSLLLFAGFFLGLGTVGADELHLIDFKTFLIRIGISFIMMFSGLAIDRIGGLYD